MDTTPQTPLSSNATMSALAGLLFFGPLVKKAAEIPQTTTGEVTEGEKFTAEQSFILGYCKVGSINIALFVILLIVFGVNYFFPSQIFNRMITLCSGAICFISAFAIFACLNDVLLFDTAQLNASTKGANETREIGHKEIILKSFIPLYNIKLRYQTANFQTPYRRLKESILRRTAFSFLTLLGGTQIGMIIIALLLIRLLLLLMNIDIIPNNLKKFLNHGFLINPEEIAGYLKSFFGKGETKEELIAQAKQQYSDMTASTFNITLQYLTFIAILRAIHRHTILTYETSILVLAALFLIGKCLLTYRTYNKLPNIPIIFEVWSLILK